MATPEVTALDSLRSTCLAIFNHLSDSEHRSADYVLTNDVERMTVQIS